MKIKSFGCSFIYGTDLKDVDKHKGQPYSMPSKYTWPSLLAQDANYEYECYARPGSGNLRILEKILSHSIEDASCVFVIGWTWIDRFDYTTGLINKPPHIYDIAGTGVWRTVMPIDTDNKATVYYRDLHSQYRDKLTNLVYIKTAIDVLHQKNIKFIMTYIDELLFEISSDSTPAVSELQNFIQPYMTKFEGKTFIDHSRQKGFAISSTMHPLEPAHQSAFETIKSYNLL
jgi:hypothetical protein